MRASSQNDYPKAAGRAEAFPAMGLSGLQAPAGCRDPAPARLQPREELPQATPVCEPLHKLIQHYPEIHQASCPRCGVAASDGPVVRSRIPPKDLASAEADKRSHKTINSLAATMGVFL